MSKTWKISNGDWDINEGTGILQTVEGREKKSQDLANSLLVLYDADDLFGSELRNLQAPPGPSASGFISMRVSEALNRLLEKDKNDPAFTSEEELTIDNIQVIPDTNDSTAYWFFVTATMAGSDTSTEEETQVNRTMYYQIGPTKLSHQLPPAVAEAFGVA